MKVIYQKLFDKLKADHVTQKQLKDAGIGGGTIDKFKVNGSVTTDTICKLCEYLDCRPEDIMDWVSDSEFEKIYAEKKEIEAQIQELQEKLKKI